MNKHSCVCNLVSHVKQISVTAGAGYGSINIDIGTYSSYVSTAHVVPVGTCTTTANNTVGIGLGSGLGVCIIIIASQFVVIVLLFFLYLRKISKVPKG